MTAAVECDNNAVDKGMTMAISRMMNGGKVLLAGLVLGVVLQGSAWAQAKPAPAKAPAAAKIDTAAVLNKAARQPMLVERITKSYTLVSQKVLEARSKRQMDDAVAEFERGLKELQAAAPTPEIKDNYQLLEQLWGEYRDLTKQAANAESNKLLAEQNEEVVWISQKGANLLVEHAKSARSDLIATAGDVRVLTQRIAKLYLFRAGGIRSQVIDEDLKNAEKQYRSDMEKLLKAQQNSPQIASELQLAETQYLFLKQAIERLNQNRASKVELENVAKTCDNILEVMERVTKLYEGMKA